MWNYFASSSMVSIAGWEMLFTWKDIEEFWLHWKMKPYLYTGHQVDTLDVIVYTLSGAQIDRKCRHIFSTLHFIVTPLSNLINSSGTLIASMLGYKLRYCYVVRIAFELWLKFIPGYFHQGTRLVLYCVFYFGKVWEDINNTYWWINNW